MDNAALRSAHHPTSSHPVSRHAGARPGPGAPGPEGAFSLLLADMADVAQTALPGAAGEGRGALDAEPAPEPAWLAAGWQPQDVAEAGIFSLTSLVGQTARMDGAADAALRDGRSLDAGRRGQAALPMGQGLPARPDSAPGLPAPALATDPGASPDPAVADIRRAQDPAATADLGAPPGTLSRTPTERESPAYGWAALQAHRGVEPLPAAASLNLGNRPGQVAGGGAAPTPAGPGTVLAELYAPATTASTAPADVPDPVLALPDEAMAEQLGEQVAFWLQQKTQRAEMTIDRQGQPVQVQVRITGNEAHVTFRSNEQQTRDMLDASSAQLREMLAQQGLSLAGVTVQTADAGRQGGASPGQGGGERSPVRGDSTDDGRQTARVNTDLRARPDSARAVDLFV